MFDLKTKRIRLGLSQTRVARLAGVSRFKIALFELGDGDLTAEEQKKITRALQDEVIRLQACLSELQLTAEAL